MCSRCVPLSSVADSRAPYVVKSTILAPNPLKLKGTITSVQHSAEVVMCDRGAVYQLGEQRPHCPSFLFSDGPACRMRVFSPRSCSSRAKLALLRWQHRTNCTLFFLFFFFATKKEFTRPFFTNCILTFTYCAVISCLSLSKIYCMFAWWISRYTDWLVNKWPHVSVKCSWMKRKGQIEIV